jgi:hypothetical protein
MINATGRAVETVQIFKSTLQFNHTQIIIIRSQSTSTVTLSEHTTDIFRYRLSGKFRDIFLKKKIPRNFHLEQPLSRLTAQSRSLPLNVEKISASRIV